MNTTFEFNANARSRVAIKLDDNLYAIIKQNSQSIAFLFLSKTPNDVKKDAYPLSLDNINFQIYNVTNVQADNIESLVANKPIVRSYPLCYTENYILRYTPPDNHDIYTWRLNSQRSWAITGYNNDAEDEDEQ